MQIQIQTDDNIQGREDVTGRVEGMVAAALERFRDQVTRVAVHLSDVNSGRAGEADKRCLIEARLARHEPAAVSHQAQTLAAAVDGAVDKMVRTLDRTLGRVKDHKGGESIRRDGTP